MENKKSFYNDLILIAVPITIQYFIGSSLNFIDTIMVGQLGDSTIAAVGIANQIFTMLNLFLLGISGGCSMFVSQFFGKKDFTSIKNIMGLGLSISIAISLIYTIIILFFASNIMALFTKDSEVIRLGTTYLKTVCLSYTITGITVVFSTICRSIQAVKIPMTASIFGILINTIGNYLLIFGHLGFPELGAKGAAVATICARVVEISILISLIYIKKLPITPNITDLLGFSKNLYKKFMRQSSLLVIKDVVFGVGITIFVAIYARIGTDAIAAVNIVNTIQNLAYVFLSGIGHASIIMIGKKLGNAEPVEAYNYAKKFQKMSVLVGLTLGAIMLLSRNLILLPFNLSTSAEINAHQVLTVTAFIFVFLGYNMISVVGILRSGGDTTFCLKMDVIAVWIIGIPLALICGFVFKLPIAWVIAINSIKDIYKSIHLTIRIASKKWINNIVDDV